MKEKIQAGPVAMRKKILVADDDTDVRTALKLVLGGEGYEVETAATGLDVETKVSEFEPDVVLMDIMMPERDGYKATEHLRARKEAGARDIKVIVMTALLSQSLVRDLEKMSIKCMKKPVDSRELLRMIKEELGEDQ